MYFCFCDGLHPFSEFIARHLECERSDKNTILIQVQQDEWRTIIFRRMDDQLVQTVRLPNDTKLLPILLRFGNYQDVGKQKDLYIQLKN